MYLGEKNICGNLSGLGERKDFTKSTYMPSRLRDENTHLVNKV